MAENDRDRKGKTPPQAPTTNETPSQPPTNEATPPQTPTKGKRSSRASRLVRTWKGLRTVYQVIVVLATLAAAGVLVVSFFGWVVDQFSHGQSLVVQVSTANGPMARRVDYKGERIKVSVQVFHAPQQLTLRAHLQSARGAVDLAAEAVNPFDETSIGAATAEIAGIPADARLAYVARSTKLLTSGSPPEPLPDGIMGSHGIDFANNTGHHQITVQFQAVVERAPPHGVPPNSSSPISLSPNGTLLVGAVADSSGVPGATILDLTAKGRLNPLFGVQGISYHTIGYGAQSLDSIVKTPSGLIVLTGRAALMQPIRGAGPHGTQWGYAATLLRSGLSSRGLWYVNFPAVGSQPILAVGSSPSQAVLATATITKVVKVSGGTSYLPGVTLSQMETSPAGNDPLDTAFGSHHGIAFFDTGTCKLHLHAHNSAIRFPCAPLWGLLREANGNIVIGGTLVKAVLGNGKAQAPDFHPFLHRFHRDFGWRAMALDRSGQLVLAGSSGGGTSDQPALVAARLDPTGDLDPTFADGRRTLVRVPGADTVGAPGVATLSDNTILLSAHAPSFSSDAVDVVKLNKDGRLDKAFGDGGFVRLHLLQLRTPVAAAAQTYIAADHLGRIYVVEIASGTRPEVAVARLLSDGALDRTYASNGVFRLNLTLNSGQVDFDGDLEANGQPHYLLSPKYFGAYDASCDFVGHSGVECLPGGSSALTTLSYTAKPAAQSALTNRTCTSACRSRIVSGAAANILQIGEQLRVHTKVGEIYCTRLASELVCVNTFGHGFSISGRVLRRW